ncbi:anther-specific proline-rich protein APG-like [Abrus precatorius]|uniref:Anther-specific proline-rich protein APG-like n=1 Tax=Abrus precatorius TaxID=3816 RepID=A0A8B8K1E3_ABRPR|nr:anther-specific proline-rich protein APG-like [Abrus precatorius]
MGPLAEDRWKPTWNNHIFVDISVPLPPERSIIIHSPPSSPSSQEPLAKGLKTFVEKGKTIIDLDPEPTPCPRPAPAPAPEWKDIGVVESSVRLVTRHSLSIQAPLSEEAGPSTRRPSPPPPTSQSPPPTISWIDNDSDDLPPSPRPQPVDDASDSDE